MNEQAVNKVLTQYVVENANLKIAVEELKQEIAALEKEKEEKKEGE